MQNLNNSSTQQPQLHLVPKWVTVTLFIVALIGFVDATFLTVEHYMNRIPPCTIGGCETVLTSSYSTVLGVPDALLGALYYFLILVLLLVYFDAKNNKVLRTALWLTPVGFLVSVYLFILQAFVIHSFCQYCLGSAATSTILFIIAMCFVKRTKNTLS